MTTKITFSYTKTDQARAVLPSARSIQTIAPVFENLVATNSELLEGLAVHLRENADGDGGFSDLGILEEAVGRLSNLTQLAVGVDRVPRQ